MSVSTMTRPTTSAARPRHLHAVNPKNGDERLRHLVSNEPPTPDCPPWCMLTHSEDTGGDRSFHYSNLVPGVSLDLRLDIDEDDRVTLDVRTFDAEGDNLDLSEVDELINALTGLRPILAATIAERAARCSTSASEGRCEAEPPACTPGSPGCLPWCTDHDTDPRDRHWQICFDDGPGLEFGDRGPSHAAAGSVRVWLSFSHPHPELPGRQHAPVMTVALNHKDGFDLEEDQVEPFACLLLAQLAVMRGDHEGARVLRKRIVTLMPREGGGAERSARAAA